MKQPEINHNTLTIENNADAEHLASIFGDLCPKESYTYESHDNSFVINVRGYLKLDFRDGKYSLCLKTLEKEQN